MAPGEERLRHKRESQRTKIILWHFINNKPLLQHPIPQHLLQYPINSNERTQASAEVPARLHLSCNVILLDFGAYIVVQHITHLTT